VECFVRVFPELDVSSDYRINDRGVDRNGRVRRKGTAMLPPSPTTSPSQHRRWSRRARMGHAHTHHPQLASQMLLWLDPW
jgi:hypothetical protein